MPAAMPASRTFVLPAGARRAIGMVLAGALAWMMPTPAAALAPDALAERLGITASAGTNGLVVQDLQTRLRLPLFAQMTVGLELTLPELRLLARGADEVEVSLPSEAGLMLQLGPLRLPFVIHQSGARLVFQEEDAALRAHFTASELSLHHAAGTGTDITLRVETPDLAWQQLKGTAGSWQQTSTAARLELLAETGARAPSPGAQGPRSQADSVLSLGLNAPSLHSTLTPPGRSDAPGLGAALGAGLTLGLRFGFDDLQASFDWHDPGMIRPGPQPAGEADALGVASSALRIDGGQFDLQLDGRRAALTSQLGTLTLGAELPGPGMSGLALELGAALLDFDGPSRPGNTSEPLHLGLELRALALSEAAWAHIDPGARIARDLASLKLEARAQGRWQQGPITAQALTDQLQYHPADLPLQLDTVQLESLHVTAFGSELNAEAQLTHGPNPPAHPALPALSGQIRAESRALERALGAMLDLGLIAPARMTQLRLALALITRPGALPDQLESRLEFRENGLYVNGQPLL